MKPEVRHKLPYLLRLLLQTGEQWINDEAPMMGAALAYYSLFSVAPLLLVAVTIAGMVFGPEAAQGEVHDYLVDYFGSTGAASVESMLQAAQRYQERSSNAVTLTVGISVLIFGASSVFNQLKLSFNRIWKVEEPRHTGIKALVFNRLLAIAMVIVVGLLLISSLVLSTVINHVSAAATEMLPISPNTLQFLDLAGSFFLLYLLFAIIYRFMPDVHIGWRSVALGAMVTSGMFAAGKFAIGYYIARGAVTYGYGAAGSVIVLLIWVYYSAQIFLFGAEFTHVYSRAKHLPAEPIEDPEHGQETAAE